MHRLERRRWFLLPRYPLVNLGREVVRQNVKIVSPLSIMSRQVDNYRDTITQSLYLYARPPLNERPVRPSCVSIMVGWFDQRAWNDHCLIAGVLIR